jgi:hypothetical protein
MILGQRADVERKMIVFSFGVFQATRFVHAAPHVSREFIKRWIIFNVHALQTCRPSAFNIHLRSGSFHVSVLPTDSTPRLRAIAQKHSLVCYRK